MTKKDYVLIADVINKEYARLEHLQNYHNSVDEYATSRQYNRAKETVHQVYLNLAFALKKENSKFDEKKFLKACGIN